MPVRFGAAALGVFVSSCESEAVVTLFDAPAWGGTGSSSTSAPPIGDGGTAASSVVDADASPNGGGGFSGAPELGGGVGGAFGGAGGGGAVAGLGGGGSGGFPNAGVRLLYQTRFWEASAAQIQPTLRIDNTSQLSIPLANLAIRYWFTGDGASNVANCNYVSVAEPCANAVSATIGRAWAPAADSVLEISFRGGYQIPPGGSAEVEVRVQRSDWENVIQSNDYSFAPEYRSFGFSPKVALYRDGRLVSGQPP